ncbi:hypothetical protein RRG08_044402 [Elysia crispata]|uniref:Uncharacterized protein n=1 Tax=Elysia crispata TaxID=231223 RepID=A0AAE0ZUQ1_9GAST|nr:hypothetical protein RRG08_044402 [Elysia crispata]
MEKAKVLDLMTPSYLVEMSVISAAVFTVCAKACTIVPETSLISLSAAAIGRIRVVLAPMSALIPHAHASHFLSFISPD